MAPLHSARRLGEPEHPPPGTVACARRDCAPTRRPVRVSPEPERRGWSCRWYPERRESGCREHSRPSFPLPSPLGAALTMLRDLLRDPLFERRIDA